VAAGNIPRRSVARWWKRTAVLPDDVAVPAPGGTDERLRETELRAHIGRAIEALTPKLRDALLLAQSGEYGYDEIAKMMNIPAGTLKWRVSEARRKVRDRLAVLGYVDAR
jgi:RNA polymerase sigma factor (sigma-70 family)